LERIRTQTIGGNGGGGIVEIPNLHGGQIDFNHVRRQICPSLITYPNHIIYSNLDTCHKTHDDIPENQYYQSGYGPESQDFRLVDFKRREIITVIPTNQSTIMITCMKLMGLSLYRGFSFK
jgi:hypothetical protein